MNKKTMKQELEKMCRNAICLDIDGKAESIVGGTRLGGVPDVPADFEWPTFAGAGLIDNAVKSRPLSFMAQFNCAELAPLDKEGLLPKTGLLSFFYEMESQCWGFDPKDAGCARVFWFEDISNLAPAQVPEDLEEDYRFPALQIDMEAASSYPGWEDFSLGRETNSDDGDLFDEVSESFGTDEDVSKLLGWPYVIQNNMTQECELVSRGYYLGDGWNEIPDEECRRAEETSAEDWRLLFQLDGVESEEEDFDLMFGDGGMIYFYIRKEDLLARRFDRIWLILQCY